MRRTVTRRLPYAPEALFDLVLDVERYPEFVPWITRLRAWNRRAGEGVCSFDAEAEVRFSLVRERFATRVRGDAKALEITVDLIDGPFRRLHNRWRFLADGQETELSFLIDFEFGPRFLTRLLNANMDAASDRLIACFEDRARALYGG